MINFLYTIIYDISALDGAKRPDPIEIRKFSTSIQKGKEWLRDFQNKGKALCGKSKSVKKSGFRLLSQSK